MFEDLTSNEGIIKDHIITLARLAKVSPKTFAREVRNSKANQEYSSKVVSELFKDLSKHLSGMVKGKK